MWRLEKTGKPGTADQKISELFSLLEESRAYQESETRWAHQYKTERDQCREDLDQMMPKEKRKWIILFYGVKGWEAFRGTKDEAVEYATGDSRHHNYGRTGFGVMSGEPSTLPEWHKDSHLNTPDCSNCGRMTRETPCLWICNNCGQRHEK